MSEPVGNGPRAPQIAGNSHRQRAAEAPPSANEQEHVKRDKIVTGEVIIKKPGVWKKFTKGFIAEDATSIGDALLNDVIRPGMKNLIRDMIFGATERALYGTNVGVRRPGGVFGTAGSSVIRGGGIREKYNEHSQVAPLSQSARARHDFSQIILPNREEATGVLQALCELVEDYHVATVSDMMDFLGQTPAYTDRKWGWRNLDAADVRQVRDGWLILLPQPQLLR